MKQGLVRLLYNLGKVHGVDITHDNVCSSMLSSFYSHLLSTGRPISSFIFIFNKISLILAVISHFIEQSFVYQLHILLPVGVSQIRVLYFLKCLAGFCYCKRPYPTFANI